MLDDVRLKSYLKSQSRKTKTKVMSRLNSATQITQVHKYSNLVLLSVDVTIFITFLWKILSPGAAGYVMTT